jgi:hypothetical protein
LKITFILFVQLTEDLRLKPTLIYLKWVGELQKKTFYAYIEMTNCDNPCILYNLRK